MEENNGYSNNYNNYDKNKEVMSMGDWFLTLIVLAIPCVNVVMYFVWAFADGNENRKNFCRVSLILGAISIVLAVVYSITTGIAFFSLY